MPRERRGKRERRTGKRADVHLRRHDSCARAADNQIERIQSNSACVEKSFWSVSACHRAAATTAAIFGPTHLTLTRERGDETEQIFSSPHAFLGFPGLDVLGFPHSVRHGLSQTGPSPHRTPRERAAHIIHSMRVVSACYFRTCMRHSSDPVLDGPFPQFRSYGRINGTGPGNGIARRKGKLN